MKCPKCGNENSDTDQFCTRCHATLRFICPACKHVQSHGGKCEQCGLDFMKYAMTVVAQSESQAELQREQARGRAALLKQIVLLPITGGFSLFKYFRDLMRGD